MRFKGLPVTTVLLSFQDFLKIFLLCMQNYFICMKNPLCDYGNYDVEGFY